MLRVMRTSALNVLAAFSLALLCGGTTAPTAAGGKLQAKEEATRSGRALVRESSIRVVVAPDGSLDEFVPQISTQSKLQHRTPTPTTETPQPVLGPIPGLAPLASGVPWKVSADSPPGKGLWQAHAPKFAAVLFQFLPTPVGFSHSEFYEHTNAKSFVILVCSIALLLMLDTVFLSKSVRSRSFRTYVFVTLFWQLASISFAAYVFLDHGRGAGVEWFLGYLLEYSFSVDNLSVFGFIFLSYETPSKSTHMLLFRGLLVGLVMRTLLFVFIGYIYAEMTTVIYFFGGLLVYSGVSTFMSDVCAKKDDESSPFMQRVKGCLTRNLRIWPHYDSDGRFFVRIKADGSDEFCESPEQEGRWHCTLLVPVIFTIEICDLMFAVDSTTAVMFQVKDFFLCCSCTMFAMAGCRSLFFLVSLLMQTFHFVKYGISINLAYIGLELCFHHIYDVPAWMTVLIVAGVLVVSVIASVACGECCLTACTDSGSDVGKENGNPDSMKLKADTGAPSSESSGIEAHN